MQYCPSLPDSCLLSKTSWHLETFHPFCQSAHKRPSHFWTVWQNLGGSRTHNLLAGMEPINCAATTPTLRTHDDTCLITVYLLAWIKPVSVPHRFFTVSLLLLHANCQLMRLFIALQLLYLLLLTVFWSTSRVGKNRNQRHRICIRRWNKTAALYFLMTVWKVAFLENQVDQLEACVFVLWDNF